MEIIGLPQKDPNNSRLYVLVKVDSMDALYLRQATKNAFEKPEDPDDKAHVERLRIYKEVTKEIWKQTNPS